MTDSSLIIFLGILILLVVIVAVIAVVSAVSGAVAAVAHKDRGRRVDKYYTAII